jgi:hypothetical protein
MGSITPDQYQEMLRRLDKSPARDPSVAAVEEQGVEEEAGLQERIISDAKGRGWWPLYSRMDLPTTTPLGTPDLIIFADNGRVIIIEAKAKNRKLRPEQLGVKMLLERLGHPVYVVRTWDYYLGIVNALISSVPLREDG